MSYERFDTDDSSDFVSRLLDTMKFHKIVKAEKHGDQCAILELDNGTQLSFYGNEGCGGCGNGWYFIEKFIKDIPDNVITDVALDVEGDEEVFTLRVFFENKELNVISYEGYDNGYYGTGFSVTVTKIN